MPDNRLPKQLIASVSITLQSGILLHYLAVWYCPSKVSVHWHYVKGPYTGQTVEDLWGDEAQERFHYCATNQQSIALLIKQAEVKEKSHKDEWCYVMSSGSLMQRMFCIATTLQKQVGQSDPRVVGY